VVLADAVRGPRLRHDRARGRADRGQLERVVELVVHHGEREDAEARGRGEVAQRVRLPHQLAQEEAHEDRAVGPARGGALLELGAGRQRREGDARDHHEA
jgi:hypothetical protein